jgi:hypothetical protein
VLLEDPRGLERAQREACALLLVCIGRSVGSKSAVKSRWRRRLLWCSSCRLSSCLRRKRGCTRRTTCSSSCRCRRGRTPPFFSAPSGCIPCPHWVSRLRPASHAHSTSSPGATAYRPSSPRVFRFGAAALRASSLRSSGLIRTYL